MSADPNYVDQAEWDQWEKARLAKNKAFAAQCASERPKPRATREDLLAQIHSLRVHNSNLLHQLDAKREEIAEFNAMLNRVLQESVAKRERPPLRVAA